MTNMSGVKSSISTFWIYVILIYMINICHSTPALLSDLQSPEMTLNEIKDLILKNAANAEEDNRANSRTGQTSTTAPDSTSTKVEATSLNPPTTATLTTKQRPPEMTSSKITVPEKSPTENNGSAKDVSVNKHGDGKVEVKIENEINIDTNKDEGAKKEVTTKAMKPVKKPKDLAVLVRDMCTLLGMCEKSLPW